MRRIVELSNAITAVISNTVKRKKLSFTLALKSTDYISFFYSLLSSFKMIEL
jgi:hypothetical protein